MSITIRPSTAADAESIGRLAAEFQSHLRAMGVHAELDWSAATYLRDGFGKDPAFEGLVADVGSTVGAYALYHFGYDTDQGQRLIYLIDLYVSPTYRRRGIGEALMRRLSDIGRARGVELIAWSVLKRDVAAMSFYETLGARYVDDRHVMWCPVRSDQQADDSELASARQAATRIGTREGG